MPIQVPPRIQRINPIDPSSQAPTTSKVVIAPVVNERARSLDKEAIDTYKTIRDNYAIVKSVEISNDFENFWNDNVYGDQGTSGLSHLQGDPYPHWEDFNERQLPNYLNSLKKHYKYNEMDARVKRIVDDRLNKTMHGYSQKGLVMRGEQFKKYSDNTFKSSIELSKQAAIDSFESRDLDVVRTKLDDTRKLLEKKGLVSGNIALKVDAKGNRKAIKDPIAMREEVIAMTDVINQGIRNSIAAKDIHYAKELIDTFGPLLDGNSFESLTKLYNNALVEYKALAMLEQTRGFDPRERKDIIKEEFEDDPEAFRMGLRLLGEEERIDDAIEKRARDRYFEELARVVIFGKIHGDIKNEADIRRLDLWGLNAPYLTARQTQTVLDIVKPDAAFTDPRALGMIYNLMLNPNFSRMSVDKVVGLLETLNIKPTDKKMVLNQLKRSKQPGKQTYNPAEIIRESEKIFGKLFPPLRATRRPVPKSKRKLRGDMLVDFGTYMVKETDAMRLSTIKDVREHISERAKEYLDYLKQRSQNRRGFLQLFQRAEPPLKPTEYFELQRPGATKKQAKPKATPSKAKFSPPPSPIPTTLPEKKTTSKFEGIDIDEMSDADFQKYRKFYLQERGVEPSYEELLTFMRNKSGE